MKLKRNAQPNQLQANENTEHSALNVWIVLMSAGDGDACVCANSPKARDSVKCAIKPMNVGTN